MNAESTRGSAPDARRHALMGSVSKKGFFGPERCAPTGAAFSVPGNADPTPGRVAGPIRVPGRRLEWDAPPV